MRGPLQLDGLRRKYGAVTALDDLSFEVPAGQVVGFLGPNGAGKTTTMRAIFGLTDLDAGTVRWNGAPVGQAERRRFGYMPEERGLYPGMLVGEQLEYLGRLHGLSALEAAAATDTWLDRLGIADRRDSKVETLSHGNQQRVQLTAALVHEPELLVLDEPLSGLDPTGIDAIGQVLVDQAACRVLRPVQQPPARPGGGPLRAGDDHRPRPPGGLRHGGRVGHQRCPAARGPRRGRPDRRLGCHLPGVTVSEVKAGAVRLVLDDSVDSDEVLRAAMRAGRVTQFSFERRRLSEVFREAVT